MNHLLEIDTGLTVEDCAGTHPMVSGGTHVLTEQTAEKRSLTTDN